VQVEVIETPELGDRSYLVHDGEQAVVIDPQRDTGRVTELAARLGVRVSLVAETHIHNDYVTGGLHLARGAGACYAVNAQDTVGFDRQGVRDGDTLRAGSLVISVIATPGHTPTHLSYAVTDRAAPQAPPAVFTGGSLLFGSVGRTDLTGPGRARELARAQFRSARRLAAGLPAAATVHPTHGFGSFCSARPSAGGAASTIGQELAGNDALTEADERAFATRLLAGLTPYPRYYRHIAPLNRRGPGPADLTDPPPAAPAALGAAIAAGGWVIDLRDRAAFAADHLAGTAGIELSSQFATYVGWLVPWRAPLTLLGQTRDQVREAQLQLARIGIGRPAGAAIGSLDQVGAGLPRARYDRVSFAQLPAPAAGQVILDVRAADEYARGHLPGARHVPLADLPERLPAIPPGRLWVHCQAGYRAGIAASLLDRAGHDVVLVDDDFARAAAARPPGRAA
jgi:glyoxylase-like metal-dependent hydrolase (beta-lactamase superfamily II)/rhodanese-related sulfurtransferase